MENRLQLQVIDIGARYGLHPSLKPLQDRCEILLIEPDREEAKQLESQYSQSPKTKVMAVALGTSKTPQLLYLRRHRGLSGFYDVGVSNAHLRSDDDQIEQVIEVETVPLMNVMTNKSTILKIDCEGADLDILKSAGSKIDQIVGIRLEISLQPCWAGSHTFQEIHSFLSANNFEFLCFDTTPIGEEWGTLPLPDSKKRFMGGDALYLRSERDLSLLSEILSASLFCYINRANGLGLKILSRADGETLRGLRKTRQNCEELLYAYVLQHLLEARRLPYYGAEQVDDLHMKLFDCPLPTRDEIFSRLNSLGLSIP